MAARISSPVLVGRDDALASLLGAIVEATAGAPRLVIVRGEAGIGKTRLLAEAASRMPAGTLLLTGECLDIGAAGLPYLPLAEALRGLARTVAPGLLEQVLGAGRADLAVLVPELAGEAAHEPAAGRTAADLPTAPPAAMTSGLAQARLFERVLGLLRALAASAPVVLVVEDVHWIDRATRDLLTFLARNLTDERLALVLTVREADLPRGHPILAWLADTERSPSTALVELRRFDRPTVERQLRLIAGADLDSGVAEGIWRRSDGNPLFVEELYASSQDGADQAGPPRSTVEVLLARVARLDRAARIVVDAVAIAARPVDDRLLAEVLEVPEAEMDDPLREAIASGVLHLEPGTDRYRFRHELLREAVERELLPGARRRLHERFARRLVARPDLADTSPVGAAGELAVHFAEAGIAAEAHDRSIAAADAAEAVHAYADAHRHLERALDLEARLPAAAADTAARVELRSRAADDADLAGELSRAMELTRAALELVDSELNPVAAGLLTSRIGYLQWSLGDGPSSLASHEAAVRLVPPDPPTPERAKVLGSLGGALMGEGRWAASRTVCEAAIECAVAAKAPAEESRARNMLGSDLVAMGEIEAGIAELREARRLAAVAGRPDMLIVGHFNLALNLAAADQLDDAVTEARAGVEVARAAGLERRFGEDLAALAADALTRLGRLDEADRAVAAGLALDARGTGTVYLSTVRARLAAIRGDYPEAERRRSELDLAALDPDVAAFVAAVRSEALVAAGRAAEAVEEAEAGLARLDGLDDVLWTAPLVALGLRGVAELAEAAGAQRHGGAGEGEGEGAVGAIGRLRDRLEWLAPRVRTSTGMGMVALARGELSRVAGGDAAADWLVAIKALDAVPDPLAAAYARLRAAEAELRARGLRAEVAGLLREAAAVANRTGARPLASAVAVLAGRARIDVTVEPVLPAPAAIVQVTAGAPDPRAGALALGLSAREVEVLALVTAGYSNGEIADRLFITRKTAAVHVTHILDKLGVANRVGAAMIGARAGLDGAVQDGRLTE
jgi:DNA-binding CsgD family transcriptional regulator/tetratricopeptide (TPR) repeat protein